MRKRAIRCIAGYIYGLVDTLCSLMLSFPTMDSGVLMKDHRPACSGEHNKYLGNTLLGLNILLTLDDLGQYWLNNGLMPKVPNHYIKQCCRLIITKLVSCPRNIQNTNVVGLHVCFRRSGHIIWHRCAFNSLVDCI